MANLIQYRVFTATLSNGSVVRKGLAVDSEDLNEEGPEYFFPPGAKISEGPTVHIEDFPALDDVVVFE